ncbi:alpha-amylase family glycosyl hydrolase [Vibrio aphrogenes]|uniref:alpha-amylase family glycosyl hydrolase n=1 Tax=Vibrio aphrogenes TaxID=1891186 RepID=UPI000B35263F|nr:alpha-amylase family glycosyl hydrolase [Vibrio aphrogenes]
MMRKPTHSMLASALALSLFSAHAYPSTDPMQNACQYPSAQQTNDLRLYQIMVESFVDGDSKANYGEGYGTSHHNGDLQGIINSLDYIQSLGVNAIWLTPIFASLPIEGQSHWDDKLDATGYFASDYFKIDPKFGTLEQAKTLVNEAHKRGLYVFFDGVFGHHKSNIVPSPTGLTPKGADNPVEYPASLPFYQQVASYWIRELKIDGWRLDQAYQVPPKDWIELKKAVQQASQSVQYTDHKGEKVHPLGYMVAEIWNNQNYITEHGYGSNEEPVLCSAFDFPMRYRLVETFAVNENSIGGKGGDWLAQGMDLQSLYPKHARPNLMLGNHDLVRFGDLLQRGYLAQPKDESYWQRHLAAISFMAAYTGPITLYYGDEIGDEVADFSDKVPNDICASQGWCDDHVARSSAKIDGVTADLTQQQTNLKQHVSQLMALRAANPVLSQGERVSVLANQDVYIDHKSYQGNNMLFMVSTSDKPQTFSLNTQQVGSSGALADMLTGADTTPNQGQYLFTLAPFEAKFLSIKTPTTLVVNKAQVSLSGDGFMAQCDNPTLEERGPIDKPLYVVGDFTDSGWKHVASRQFSYKGQGVYQAVVDEQAGSYRMQYASQDWKPQFTSASLEVSAGKVSQLKYGGYGKDTAALIPESGKYVWSLQFSDSGSPEKIMLSKCSE